MQFYLLVLYLKLVLKDDGLSNPYAHFSVMASGSVPDVWKWILSLPVQSEEESQCLQICHSPSSNQSLKLGISRQPETQSFHLSLSICAEFHAPISLWTSSSSKQKSIDREEHINRDTVDHFFHDIICGILRYGPHHRTRFRLPDLQIYEDFSNFFNLAILTLALLVCIYEAPCNVRQEFINAIRAQLMSPKLRQAAKLLMLALGSNLEEQWMRSLNLGVTSWILETRQSRDKFISSPTVFSYALSASRLWKVQLYCPVVAMIMEPPSHPTKDEKLLFSLNYQQFEGVIQFGYRVNFKENWIDVVVDVDNIRCDLIQLLSETLMTKQGYGSDEKHFPSRISLQLTPTMQSDILSVSVSRSTNNPVHEIGTEKGIETAFSAQSSPGINFSSYESVTMSLKPWKFEQSVYGNSAMLNWFLHDGAKGREVFSSEPPKLELLQPRSWFKNRYTSAYRPFTRGGGIIFAGDEYGESVCWKMSAAAAGKAMEWEIKGKVWLTYWPNKKRTFHTETRRLEFRELLHLTVGN